MRHIEGFNEDQIKALCKMWHLGSPIDVIGFFDRLDIPVEAKDRVREVGVAVDEGDLARGAALCIAIIPSVSNELT